MKRRIREGILFLLLGMCLCSCGEMEEETDYNIQIDGEDAGTMRTNLGGKLSLSVELEAKKSAFVKIIRA